MTMIPTNLNLVLSVRRTRTVGDRTEIVDVTEPGISADAMLTPDNLADLRLRDFAKMHVEIPLRTHPEMPPAEMTEWLRKTLIQLLQTPEERARFGASVAEPD